MCETEPEAREKRSNKGKHGTNEMLESDNPPPEYKSDYMVIDLGDTEVNYTFSVLIVPFFTYLRRCCIWVGLLAQIHLLLCTLFHFYDMHTYFMCV